MKQELLEQFNKETGIKKPVDTDLDYYQSQYISWIEQQLVKNNAVLSDARQRYFAVVYRASSHKGMLDGQININVKCLYLERARVSEIIKENHKEIQDVIITNIIEMSEQEYECWVANDA